MTVFPRGRWMDAAECREDNRPDWITKAQWSRMFFPARGENPNPAKSVCRECPVRVECLEYAMTAGIHHGIWGGESERSRQRLRRQRPEFNPAMIRQRKAS